jgi:predicted ribosome quality control (RQC) complex YloA/Tae2 family protein
MNSKIVSIGGYYLSQISGITKDSLLLKFHHSTERDILITISTRGMWITKMVLKQVEENDLVRSAKKELERSRIISIKQLGSERIAILKFEQHDLTIRHLICEFFGQGNIIICDESMKILSILNSLEVRHRTLRTGLKYSSPPSKGLDIFNTSLEEFQSQYQNETKNLEISRWLGRSLSISKKFVEEILFRGNIDKAKKIKDLHENDIISLYKNTKKLVDEVVNEQNHSPVIELETSNVPIDAYHTRLKMLASPNLKSLDTFMSALDEVLSNDIITIGKRIHTVELDKKLEILQHDLFEQDKAKQIVLTKSNMIRKLASDLMTIPSSNAVDLENALDRNSSKLILEKGKKYLSIGEELIPFDDNVRKVSSLLYVRAKEMERGSETIDKARLKILDEIEILKRKTDVAEKKIDIKEQKSKEWFERYRWFITSGGLLVIGGRDASSNSAIIRKHMTEQDVVFHAEIHGSPFFLIKNIGSDELEINKNSQSLQEGAIATVSFSRAWKDGLSSADAYWVYPNQVKKGAPTGQFLPKGSFVIEGKRNFVKGLEMKLSIGVSKENHNSYKIICGPLESVKSKCIIYVILLPGTIDPMLGAKKIKTELINNSQNDNDMTVYLKKISLDDIIRVLPSGKIKIISSERGKLSSN